MKGIAVLQVRTNSSRLPAKSLLQVGGLPLCLLSAFRAANTGREIIVVTSTEASDDALVEILQNYGLRYYRGSLDNVLSRFVEALSKESDETIVIRLTADNVLPDGALLDEIEKEFIQKKLEYLCCNGESSGLPYGVSVEMMRLSSLREADNLSSDPYEREHVTPYIIRKFGLTYFNRYLHLGKGHFRCTVDCLDDYLNILSLFSGVSDPVLEPMLNLVKKMECNPCQPATNSPVVKMVLGAAQLGFDYGIANSTGKPSDIVCEKLIKTSIINGVQYIDTARSYGESEELIGAVLKSGWLGRAQIITKLSLLNDCPLNADQQIVSAFVNSSVYESCVALGVKNLDVLMLHRTSYIKDWSGAVWKRLINLKISGVIRELGASVQNPDELLIALATPEIQYIQLPCNILDWRWEPFISKILAEKEKRKITIHARSTLLQGLLTSNDKLHWSRANEQNPQLIMDWLKKIVIEYERKNVVDLCINYVNSLEWIDGLVLGMETLDQLSENMEYFCTPVLNEKEIYKIQLNRPKLNLDTLDPAMWRME